MVYQFTVHGEPEPAGSKRGFARGKHVSVTDANPKSADWKKKVAQVAGEYWAGRELLTGPIFLRLIFYRPRPQSHYGSGKNEGVLKSSAPNYPTTKPDVLKLARGVEDALTGVIYRDDSQIVSESLLKDWGNARVEVLIDTLKP